MSGRTPSRTRSEPVNRDSLLRAAAGIFRAKGYGSSTTRELAGELGIKRASLYHHITGKEELLHSICLLSLERITAAVRRAVQDIAPERRLEAAIAAHVETALSDIDMHSVMLVELRSLSDEHRADVVRLRDEYEALLSAVIEADQAAGRTRSDIDARMLTLSLLNLLNWTIFWYQPGTGVGPAELGRQFTTIYLHGVHLPAAPPEDDKPRDG